MILKEGKIPAGMSEAFEGSIVSFYERSLSKFEHHQHIDT